MKILILGICTAWTAVHALGQTPPSVPAPATATPAAAARSRDIPIKAGQTFLNLPVNPSSPSVRMTIHLDGKAITASNIRLSDSPEFWTFFDVSDYQGKTLTIEIALGGGRGGAAAGTIGDAQLAALEKVFADVTYPGRDKVYSEPERPQVHFSSQRGHLNDPNGLVYYNGEYHMYYQHNPYGIDGGNQHWGHAVSSDMLHWIQLPEAIYPTMGLPAGRGDLAFSGSATYDPQNTAGFRKNGIDPLIVFYTSTGRGECIKLSYDNGRTFIDYEANPILSHNGRDPKILWYAPGNHWVMVVWDGGQPRKLSNGEEISVREHSIYASSDMKKWTYQSGVAGFFECPDLFELPVEGEPGVAKWVLSDANGRYMVGTFDGKNFTAEQQMVDYVYGGRYYYAAQTFNNSPDQRRVQIGWGNYDYPRMPFTQTMLFPTELKLKKTEGGLRLTPTPIREIASLYRTSQLVENKIVTVTEGVSLSVDPNAPIHVVAEFERGDAPLSLNIGGYRFGFDNEWVFSATPPTPAAAAAPTVPAGGPNNGPAVPAAGPARGGRGGNLATPTAASLRYTTSKPIFKIEAILDKDMLEVFVNDGELYYVTALRAPSTGRVESLITAGGIRGGGGRGAPGGGTRKFIVKRLEVHELNSIWPKM